MSADIRLTDFLKLWIKSKVFQFYRQDPYLKQLMADVALSHLGDALVASKSLSELKNNLSPNDYTKGVRLTRKLDGQTLFEYPSLSFQIESLLVLWPAICQCYEKLKLLDRPNRYGHRPNLTANFNDLDEQSTIREKDITINCALKIPFQEDYPNFKKAVVDRASEVLKPLEDENEYVLVIQSDIEKFFHRLSISTMVNFLESHYKDLGRISAPFFSRLMSEFKFSSLPIGWQLSGIFADLAAVQFHARFNKNLDSLFQENLKALDLSTYAKGILSPEESTDEKIKLLTGLLVCCPGSFVTVGVIV